MILCGTNLAVYTTGILHVSGSMLSTVMPKLWNWGRIPNILSLRGSKSTQSVICWMFAAILAWESMTPLGLPLVPEVYSSTANRSSSMSLGQKRSGTLRKGMSSSRIMWRTPVRAPVVPKTHSSALGPRKSSIGWTVTTVSHPQSRIT